jgi:DNA-binding IclR family transcriptional regulator
LTAPRFRIEPRDVPAVAAARRLGLTEAQFRECLPDLLARGFPAADPTTGNYDLKAAELWLDRRSGLGAITEVVARDASSVVMARIQALGRDHG